MEIWDLYDKNRNKLDITMQKGDKVPCGTYRLAVKLCIFNHSGQMLIQQRASTKSSYPEYWDISVRGSAICGESSEMAIKRESKEEVGIDLEGEDIRPNLTMHDKEWFDDIYLLCREIDIDELVLQQEEVLAVQWMDLAGILAMKERGDFIPYSDSLIGLLFSRGELL